MIRLSRKDRKEHISVKNQHISQKNLDNIREQLISQSEF